MRLVATLTIALVTAALSAGISQAQTSDLVGTWTAEATEPFIGALSQDGRPLHLVKVDDNGLIFATRHGDDQIELTYMEAAPHAIAYTAIFSRQE